MSRRYVVQLHARFPTRCEEELRGSLDAEGIGVIDLHHAGDCFVIDGHLALIDREQPLDAHHRIKRGLGALSLRSRWLDLDEFVWEKEIRDASS